MDSKETYNSCMRAYYEWHRNTVGFLPKIDGSDGRALKEIIKYLNSLSKNEAENMFRLILSRWSELPIFYKKNTRLRQINSNIHNIVYHFKNNNNVTGVSEDYVKDILAKLYK